MLSDLTNMKFEMNERIKLSNEEQSFKNLASLDLQPIVKVYEIRGEVEVTGYLVLSGEFIIKNQYWEEQLDQFDALHYNNLNHDNYKVDSFQHQIPLSIRIDNSRIENISDVIVEIDSFDYKIISNQEVEIISVIKLHGVKPDSKKPVVQSQEIEQVESQKVEKSDTNINDYDKKEGTEIETSDPNENKFKNPIYSLLKKEQKNFKDLLKSSPDESKISDEKISETEVEAKAEKEPKAETVNAELVSDDSNEEYPLAKVTIDKGDNKVKDESDISESNMLYGLLKGDEIKRYKMKIYLVQRDDTIEKIADKYGINSEDIYSNNNIENEKDLQLGQLLYIPTI